MLGEDRAAGIVRSVSSALSILLGLIICYGMMILVSVAMILMIGTDRKRCRIRRSAGRGTDRSDRTDSGSRKIGGAGHTAK